MSTKYLFHPALDAPEKPRNFFINIDGTWNDPSDASQSGSGTTNVLRFHKAIMRDEGQYSRYFSGVGNQEQHGLLGQIFGGAFGAGAEELRNEAYVVLATNYRPGDRIFITGFSRGAAIARLVAALIHKEGIPEAIEYKKDDSGRITSFNAMGQKKDVDVEMLGCWDTVASFGIPVNLFGIPFQEINLFKDFTVSECVKKAYHLVSVDENRSAFKPTLMNQQNKVDEVWFAGVHADVGGGYERRRLADITLRYMIERVQENHGVRFHQESLEEIVPNPHGEGIVHEHGDRPLDYKMESRQIGVLVDGKLDTTIKPKIHATVTGRKERKRTAYVPKNLLALGTHYEIIDG